MSKHSKNKHELENLVNSLVEDILCASDDEILENAKEDYGDAKQVADNTRALFEKARVMVGKKRLVSAKEELALKKRGDRKILRLNPTEARERLNTILNQYPEAANELTLAARKGGNLSDNDVMGMLEDLEDLGISPSSDKPSDNG